LETLHFVSKRPEVARHCGRHHGHRRPNRDRLGGRVIVKDYIERRDGSLYVIGSRVPLAIVVHGFQNGDTPEAIQSNFPTLTLERVYGAITFYLANKDEVERDMTERRRIEDEFIKTHPNPPGLKQKLLDRREQMLSAAKLKGDPLPG